MKAPLAGVRIIEFEGIGPGPLAGLMLADMGADVTVIVRPEKGTISAQLAGPGENPMRRGKTILPLDLKDAVSRNQAMALLKNCDGLIEGNRPGVMERLGLGPADCSVHNQRLVYGRMTGWGQSGPLAQVAGHDLNYVALTGLLSLSTSAGQKPMVPPTVVGDASGALGLAFGMVCALLAARQSGLGRVVDSAIVDVVAMLGGIAQMVHASGQLGGPKPSPFHDSPFYDVYVCADGKYITLGALEPQFYKLALEKLGLQDVDVATQYDTHTWPELKTRIAALIASQSRAHWSEQLEGTDVCFAPVLSMQEALDHPHNVARGTYLCTDGNGPHVAAAPRFLPLQ